MTSTRRQLLQAAAVAPLAGSLRWLPGGDARSVVVIELEGGNDGLNMLIPLDDAAYAAARPTLSAVRNDALPLGDGHGLHAALRGVHELLQGGFGAVVHGVGYPTPDRSHFRSRDIWHTADVGYVVRTARSTGWLGRAADALAAAGAALPAMSVGSSGVPLMLAGQHVVVPSLERLEDCQLLVDPSGGAEDLRRQSVLELLATPVRDTDGTRSFLREVARSAADSAERLRVALATYAPKADYPDGELARSMQLLSRILVSGFGTRLLHLSFGGFDTHARQLPAHDGLLRTVSSALTALVQDLRAHGALGDVTILVHSEFGRRLAENNSRGTDHGAAAPVLVFGEGLAGKQIGTPPDLNDLQDGDPRATCDFRAVYAAILRRLRIDDRAVLGGGFDGVSLFG